jgi:hypothetical protein
MSVVELKAVGKLTVVPLIRLIPGYFLLRKYPAVDCQQMVEVAIPGLGPHISIIDGALPVITGIRFSFANRLPFPVSADSISLQMTLEGVVLGTWESCMREEIPAQSSRILNFRNIDLTDAQSRAINRYRGDGPTLRFSGTVVCVSARIQNDPGVRDERLPRCASRAA